MSDVEFSLIENLSRGEAGRNAGSSSTEETSSGSSNDGVSINMSDDSNDRETIAVIGSGDFGRALASRMVKSGGYNVVVGSRDPDKNR